MWTIMEGCETLNATESSLFVRAHRMYGRKDQKPYRDHETYRELGVIPPYVSHFLEYHRMARAVG